MFSHHPPLGDKPFVIERVRQAPRARAGLGPRRVVVVRVIQRKPRATGERIRSCPPSSARAGADGCMASPAAHNVYSIGRDLL